MYKSQKLEKFNQNVWSKYKIYNSLFLTLPFDKINKTGVLLPLFTEMCEQGFRNNETPKEIFKNFISKYIDNDTESKEIELLFRFIQYIERQIVLFDALEDAAFSNLNNMKGRNTISGLKENADYQQKKGELLNFVNTFKVRTVLTAHPTQFYPGNVLGIIRDLTDAILTDDIPNIEILLAQLGKTPFFKKEKPTPYDEAVSLIWFLENVFYPSISDIMMYIQKNISREQLFLNDIFSLGFWPGGDRDGNPFVTNEITLKVAERLRTSILKCYYNDVKNLKRKLTFPEVDKLIEELENKLYRSVFYSKGEIYITKKEFIHSLNKIRTIVIEKHQSLYVQLIDELIIKFSTFGFHFANLDIRQNSKVHQSLIKEIIKKFPKHFPKNYDELSEIEKIEIINHANLSINDSVFSDELLKNTINSITTIQEIQGNNGEMGCNRYIISNNENALNVIEVLNLFYWTGWSKPTVDIIPLFESVSDLDKAAEAMEILYTNPTYKKHLKFRNNTQTIMLGFSDGTKDGGYLTANWAIYKAKKELTKISRKYNIEVIFFDGRGGPPARGGGKTHQFYASLGSEIESKQIQLTIQGQTISSNFGTLDSCRYNLENLLTAGANNLFLNNSSNSLSKAQNSVLEELSKISFDSYITFKNHPKFVPYLEHMSTLNFYSKANIGSRPSKRKQEEKLNLNDLRAIPFVGSWSQLKHNVPGFFGVGTALKFFEENNRWHEVVDLYNNSLFFKTLLENSMMALCKSFLPLTAYIQKDKEFGAFWNIINEEYNETKRLLLKVSGFKELMENYPDGKASIEIREKIVLPLLTIQQYALMTLRELKNDPKSDEAKIKIYEKIVTRSLFGNINASRNSA